MAGMPPGLIQAQRPDPFISQSLGMDIVRPDPSCPIGAYITLFHDCPEAEMVIRQIPNRAQSRVANCGLQLETFDFSGSFCTLKFKLPFKETISPDQILAIRAFVQTTDPILVHARLSISKGAHSETMVREMDLNDPFATAEFDLHFIETRLDGSQDVWIDLSFTNIAWSKLILRDVVLLQSKRAEA